MKIIKYSIHIYNKNLQVQIFKDRYLKGINAPGIAEVDGDGTCHAPSTKNGEYD